MITLYLTTIVLFALLFLIKYVRFLRAYHTQRTITRLRDLRHEASLYVTDWAHNSSEEGRREIRELISSVDRAICNFDKIVKKHFMTLRGMKKMIVAISDTNTKLRAIEVDKDIMLIEYRKDLAKALLSAFNAVPFGRIRILFSFSKTIFKLLALLGIAKLQKYVALITSLETSYNDDLRTSGKAKHHSEMFHAELC